MTSLDSLRRHLLDGSRACVRPPVDRFRHPWLAPMPLSDAGRRVLTGRARHEPVHLSTDGFAHGDYGLGLFHHDVSEAAIELIRHDDLREACVGSLLCFLDAQDPDGRIHRIELPWKAREHEPAKPVIAQLAARCLEADPDLAARFDRERVLPRLLAWIAFLEREYTGLHGLFLTHSSLQSGFDNDLLTAGLPDRSVEGPDTNTFVVLELEAAAAVARALGEEAEAARLAEKAALLRERIERLLWWEDGEGGGFYVGLRWQRGGASLLDEMVAERDPDGCLRPLESWVCLLPLYAGIPSPERAEALIARLVDPERYGGPAGPRTVPRDSPYFQQGARVLHFDWKKQGRGPVSNWQGPVWVLSAYYLAAGAARYGRTDVAREITRRVLATLAADLATTGTLHECWDDAGRGLWPRRGTFVSWNVLALTMARAWGDP